MGMKQGLDRLVALLNKKNAEKNKSRSPELDEDKIVEKWLGTIDKTSSKTSSKKEQK